MRKARYAKEAYELKIANTTAHITEVNKAKRQRETSAVLKLQAFFRGILVRNRIELRMIEGMRKSMGEKLRQLNNSFGLIFLTAGNATRQAATLIQKNFRARKIQKWYSIAVIEHRVELKRRKDAAILVMQCTIRMHFAKLAVIELKEIRVRDAKLIILRTKIAARLILKNIKAHIRMKKLERDRQIRLQRRKGWRLKKMISTIEKTKHDSSQKLGRHPSELKSSNSGTQNPIAYSSSKATTLQEFGGNVVEGSQTSDEIHESEIESEIEKCQTNFKPYSRGMYTKHYESPTEAQAARMLSASPVRNVVKVKHEGIEGFSSALNHLFGASVNLEQIHRRSSLSSNTSNHWRYQADENFMRDTYVSSVRSGAVVPPIVNFQRKPKSKSVTLNYLSSTTCSRIYAGEAKAGPKKQLLKWATNVSSPAIYTPGLDNSMYQPQEWSPIPYRSRSGAASRPRTTDSNQNRTLRPRIWMSRERASH